MLHCFYLCNGLLEQSTIVSNGFFLRLILCSLFPCTSSTERYSVLLKDICFNIWFGHNRCVNPLQPETSIEHIALWKQYGIQSIRSPRLFYCNTVIAWRLIWMSYLSPVIHFPFYWFSFTITPFNCDYCIHHDLQLKNHVVTFLASRKCQTVNYRVELLLHLSKSNLQSKWKQVFRLISPVEAVLAILATIYILR